MRRGRPEPAGKGDPVTPSVGLRHLLTTTSLLALTAGAAGEAQAQCAATIASAQAGCTNSGTQASIQVNSGVTITGAIVNAGTLAAGGGQFGIYVNTGAIVTGGITNTGTISTPSSTGYHGAIVVVGTVSSGGITNSGKITSSY